MAEHAGLGCCDWPCVLQTCSYLRGAEWLLPALAARGRVPSRAGVFASLDLFSRWCLGSVLHGILSCLLSAVVWLRV